MIKITSLILKSRYFFKSNGFIKRYYSINADSLNIPYPTYNFKENEDIEVRKNRLIYQSRRRGILENDLLLSTFVDEFLSEMSLEKIEQYDRLINMASSDWDIYYWATGVELVPKAFDNDMMKLLQQHARNSEKKSRLRQPDLKNK